MKWIIVIISLSLAFSLIAQEDKTSVKSKKNKAERLYESLGYKAAADIYSKMDEEKDLSKTEMVRLANSYRLNGDFESAEYWYARFIKDTQTPEHYLHYAQMLQSNGKCQDAVRWYREYAAVADKSELQKRDFINDCTETTNLFPANDDLVMDNVSEINTGHIDIAPVWFDKGIVFTSTRSSNKLQKNKDTWTGDNFTDLFYAKKQEDGTYSKPQLLKGEHLNGKFHDGASTFNTAETMMYFSRSGARNKKGYVSLKIYSATKESGYWNGVTELPFNIDTYSTCHPTLSKDGKKLYFASNRPGGYGGMDIYVSEKLGGNWRIPVNLGPIINSAGNDMFPYMANNGQLYFSSDGHKGLGGLDIFYAKKLDESDENSWAIRQNMGYGYNSMKDDLSFIMHKDGTHGYLCSNRGGGLGNDDIYEWRQTEMVIPESSDKVICFYNEKNDKRIEGVRFSIMENTEAKTVQAAEQLYLTLQPVNANNKEEYLLGIKGQEQEEGMAFAKLVSNTEGVVNVSVKEDKSYLLVAEKSGFQAVKRLVKANEILAAAEYCIPMGEMNCLELVGKVKNADYDKFIPNAKITLFSRCTGEIIETMSDASGSFDFCLECDCDYEVLANKEHFAGDMKTVSTLNINCPDTNPLNVLLELSLSDETILKTPGAVSERLSTPESQADFPQDASLADNNIINQYFLGDKKGTFEEGMLINLKNIYYDFDKYNIRTDAELELDYVARLLVLHPEIEILLMAHTDARGKDYYNKWLSRKRSTSARKYLLKKGISSRRIKAKGYGEDILVNECGDGVECSDEEHQLNRRTEIMITNMKNEDVKGIVE